MRLSRFIQTLRETRLTPAQRFVARIEQLRLPARLALGVDDDRDVSVQRLSVTPTDRGQGYARETMTALCKAANRAGITLHLEAHPDEDDPDMDLTRLVQFYRSFGFQGAEHPERDAMMWRSPRRSMNEIYSSDNSALLRYLKAAEPDHYQFWHEFEKWLTHYAVSEFPKRTINACLKLFDEEEPETFYKMPKPVQDAFIHWMRETGIHNMMQHEPAEAPTWAHVDVQNKRLINRETWLIHFSDYADDIARQGFRKGVYDMTKLGLTTHLSKYDKASPGYNFAFLAGTRAVSNYHAGYSRNGSVMFQNSGVHTYHYGDEFDQIIFNGSDVNPKSIILLSGDGYENWSVNVHPTKAQKYRRDVIYQGNLNQVQNWVMANAMRYRKVLTGW